MQCGGIGSTNAHWVEERAVGDGSDGVDVDVSPSSMFFQDELLPFLCQAKPSRIAVVSDCFYLLTLNITVFKIHSMQTFY